MNLKTKRIMKSGHSHYIILDKGIVKEYDLKKGQKLERKVDFNENGFTIHYSLSQSSILEKDIESLSDIFLEDPDLLMGMKNNEISCKPALFRRFNPSLTKRKIMEPRLDNAFKKWKELYQG